MSVNVLGEKATTTIKQAIDSFLLSCKVAGKYYGTIECYSDKLKGFPLVYRQLPPARIDRPAGLLIGKEGIIGWRMSAPGSSGPKR